MNIDLNIINESMPNFKNHEEAYGWFEQQFQDKFRFRTQDSVNGKMVYYYHLVKNPDVYQQYMETLENEVKSQISNFDTFESYSTVEISEDGEVSFTP
jgi:hypothetical protein